MAGIRPAGANSSPQAKTAPSRPPRAARSHSASVGSDLPAHVAYASASSGATWTTGWRLRPATPDAGPSGCNQLAPGTYSHQVAQLRRSTGPSEGRNTSDPGTSSSGSAPG